MRPEIAEDWAAWARRFVPEGGHHFITVSVEQKAGTASVVIRATSGLALAEYFDNVVRRTAGLEEER